METRKKREPCIIFVLQTHSFGCLYGVEMQTRKTESNGQRSWICNQKKGDQISLPYSIFLLVSFSSQPPFAEVLGSELLLNGLSFSPFRGCFGQVLFPQFSIVDSKTMQRSALWRSRRELAKKARVASKGKWSQSRVPFCEISARFWWFFCGILPECSLGRGG